MTKRLFAVFALVGLVFLAWGGVANALSFHSGNNVLVRQTEKIDHTVFAGGNNVDINAEVYGDVFCAGQTVRISGTIHGDVICAGQTVTITGKVDGDVRLAGQNVVVSANVGGNATIAGQTFMLDSNASIDGDTTVGSSTALFNGSVGRDLLLGSQSANLNSVVGRDIKAGVTDLELGKTAKVKGNINYTSDNQLVKQDGAEIGGTVTQEKPKKDTGAKRISLFGFSVFWFLFLIPSLLLVSIVLAFLFPDFMLATTERGLHSFWKPLLTGFLAFCAAPIVFVLLMVSMIGIPLGLIALLAWLVIISLSGPISGLYLGRRLFASIKHPVLSTIFGGLLLLVLYYIPVVGFFALLWAGCFGSGMLLQQIFQHTKNTKTKAATVKS